MSDSSLTTKWAGLYIGRSPEREDGNPQLLKDHLVGASVRARTLGDPIGLGGEAATAALLHDLGKYSEQFQRRIRGMAVKADHASPGAALAADARSLELAYAIAAHHRGLSDFTEVKSLRSRTSRNDASQRLLDEARALLVLAECEIPDITVGMLPSTERNALRMDLRIRMLLSLLVDADRLDAEAFGNPLRALKRDRQPPTLDEMLARTLEHIGNLKARAAAAGRSAHPVQRLRDAVAEQALTAASAGPGFYSMTVPTGGGKTLSGLVFALQHAIANHLDRVIIVLPYLNIIDQTADTLRIVLGASAVLEHHSGVLAADSRSGGEDSELSRLLIENWSAPLIITTSVQFAESLFSAHPRRLRKVHNIARSVVIFDEIQSFPVNVMGPFLEMLEGLRRDWQTSFLFMTATQPALETSARVQTSDPRLSPGSVKEVCPPEKLPPLSPRTTVTWPAKDEALSIEDVARMIAAEPSVLAIFNTRGDARSVHAALVDAGVSAKFLSTNLCPAHRREILRGIRVALAAGVPVRVVSTQLVEAGVDLDFPAVIRVEGPLDSITQAAGRCNREGAMNLPGRVRVIRLADGKTPPGIYSTATDLTRQMASSATLDLADLSLYPRYFDALYGRAELDPRKITDLRRTLDFPAVEKAFRLIDEGTSPVLVPYGPVGARLIAALRSGPVDARTRRLLGSFTVSLRPYELDRGIKSGQIEQVADPDVYVAMPDAYDAIQGLVIGRGPGLVDASALVV